MHRTQVKTYVYQFVRGCEKDIDGVPYEEAEGGIWGGPEWSWGVHPSGSSSDPVLWDFYGDFVLQA